MEFQTGRRPVVVPLFLAINALVFTLWYLAKGQEQELFMAQNFLVSWDALSQGRWWDLLTSVFSHNWLFHFLLNMMVLSSFGNLMEVTLGWRFFTQFYILAGLAGSIGHCVVSRFLLNEPQLPALGASGALSGLILLFAFVFPRERIYAFWVIPLPAIFGALVFVGLDVWGLVEQTRGGGLPIGHGAHLGGALAGLICYMGWIRPRMRVRR